MKQQYSAYVKYSTLGLQMIAAILIAAFIGNWIDGEMGNGKPIMTMIFMLVGVTTSIILLIRGVQKTEKDEEKTKKNDSSN